MSKHAFIMEELEAPPIMITQEPLTIRELLKFCRDNGLPMSTTLRVRGGDKCYDATHTNRVGADADGVPQVQLCREQGWRGPALTVGSLVGSLPMDAVLRGPSMGTLQRSFHTVFGGLRLEEIG